MTTQQRMLLAGLISILIFVGYFYLFPPPEPTPSSDEAGEQAKAEGEEGGENPAEPGTAEPAGPAPSAPLEPASSIAKVEHRLVNDELAAIRKP